MISDQIMITHKQIVAFALIAMVLSVSSAYAESDSYVLVSQDEYTRSLEIGDLEDSEVDEFIERAADPLAPAISVKKPGEGSEYQAPVDIEVAFLPSDGATIVLDSLKITYGSLGINVTDRVTKNAKVTRDGIWSKGARLPTGKHKLTISIADDQGRIGKRKFRFRIVE